MAQIERPLNVAVVISDLEFGGAQRQAIELANRMPTTAAKLTLVSLSATNLQLRDKIEPGVAFRVIEKRSKFDVGVARRLARTFRALDIDVAHGMLFDAEIAVRLAGRLAGTRLVVGSERNAGYTLGVQHKLAYALTRRWRDLCIANSSAGAAFNADLLGYPPDHYRVVYNGVDSDRFVPRSADPERLAAMGLDPAATYVGMIGSFKEQKNHRMFFRVAKRLLDDGHDVRFLLVGDSLADSPAGTYRATVRDEVRALGVMDRCDFVGNQAEVEGVYPLCALTVLPSFFEGTPNVALESMACGVPVIATAVSDNGIVIPDGEVGHVVPVEDDAAMAAKIARLLVDDALRATLGAAARRWVSTRFSLDALARNTLDAYRDGLARG